jgi:hypothetical protein
MKNKFIIGAFVFVAIVVIISFRSQKSETKDTDFELNKNRNNEVKHLRERGAPQKGTQKETPKLERKISNRKESEFTAIDPRKFFELSDMGIETINIIKKSLASGSVLSKSQENVDPIERIEEAFDFMNVNVNMAYVPSKYLEDDEAFYFSGGTTSEEVLDFSSGIAVNKKDRTITSWDSKP